MADVLVARNHLSVSLEHSSQDFIEPSHPSPDEHVGLGPAFMHSDDDNNNNNNNMFGSGSLATAHEDDSNARRHGRSKRSIALPAFNFNPGAERADAIAQPSLATPPQTPSSRSDHSSPTRGGGRHRRQPSEFLAGDVRMSPASTRTSSPAKSCPREPEDIPDVPPIPSRIGHRHRRSGAVSQDLTGGVAKSSPVKFLQEDAVRFSGGVPPALSSNTLQSLAGVSAFDRSDSVASNPASSHRHDSSMHVSFAENVRLGPSLHELPSPGYTNTPELLDSPVFDDEPRLEVDPSEPTFDDADAVFGSDVDWYNDPTEIRAYPTIQSVQRVFSEEPSSPSAQGPDHGEGSDSAAIIDLDSEFSAKTPEPIAVSNLSSEELRSIRAQSFSAARKVMRSGGAMSNGISSSEFHRRTESAPSLPLPSWSWERPAMQRLRSDLATHQKFEMHNVFEEEEEDAAQIPDKSNPALSMQSKHSVRDSVSSHGRLESAQKDGDSSKRRSNSLGSVRHSHTPDEGLPNAFSNSMDHASWHLASFAKIDGHSREADRDTCESSNSSSTPLAHENDINTFTFPLPAAYSQTEPSFGSQSGRSTPRLDSDTSASGPAHSQSTSKYPSAYLAADQSHSLDRVPSLVSSRSTLTHQPPASPASPSLLNAPIMANPRHSFGTRADWRRKRSSIASLSKLLGGTMEHRKSGLANSETLRCQSSDGLADIDSSKANKTRRLSRLLRFWKPKEDDL